jgi:hypothetical protein
MKVAVFGDSFAHTEPWNEDRAWYSLLNGPDVSITNFAHTGSSVWYSYDLFQKNHHLYDRCIFLVTNWGRFYAPQLQQPFWPGINQIEDTLKNSNLSHNDRNVLTSMFNWIVFGRNEAQEVSLQELMVKDIITVRSDSLVIPCFDYSMSRVKDWSNCSMFDIHTIDMLHYGIEYQNSRGMWQRKPLRPGGRELRACHMNDKNNSIFANKIKEWLKTEKFSMKKEDFVTAIEPVEYYFELGS